MKLSFSTLACPNWSFSEIVSAAKDLGYDGIEFRGVEREMYAPKIKEFQDENIKSTMNRLKKLDIEIPILSSAAYLFDKKHIDTMLNEAYDYVVLAHELGVDYVRVLGDYDAKWSGNEIDIDFLLNNFKKVCLFAHNLDVTVLLETNGIFGDSKCINEFLEMADMENSGVLWDIHHTYRFFDEKPADTVKILDDKIKHVHIKDSIIENDKVIYKMTGTGNIPCENALKALKDNGYNEYISLEWVKRWMVDLTEAEIALPHFIYYINNLL